MLIWCPRGPGNDRLRSCAICVGESMTLRWVRGLRHSVFGKGGRRLVVGLFVALALFPGVVAGRSEPPRPDPGDGGGGSAAPGDLTLVGSLALPGFNADIWGHKGYAYIGLPGYIKKRVNRRSRSAERR